MPISSFLEFPFEFPVGSRHIYSAPASFSTRSEYCNPSSSLETLVFLIQMVLEESNVGLGSSFSSEEVFYYLNRKWPQAFHISQQVAHLAPIREALSTSQQFLVHRDGRWRLAHTASNQIVPRDPLIFHTPGSTAGESDNDEESLVELEHDGSTYDSSSQRFSTPMNAYKRALSPSSSSSGSTSTAITTDSDMESTSSYTSVSSNEAPHSPSLYPQSPQSTTFSNPTQTQIPSYPFENYKPLHTISDSTYEIVGRWIHFSFDPEDVWHDLDELKNQNKISSLSMQRHHSADSLTDADAGMDLGDMLHLDALVE